MHSDEARLIEQGNIYDEAYYLRGKESGKSLYENYRWMPNLTHRMVRAIVAHCGIRGDQTVLDYGCLVEGSPIITKEGVRPIEELNDGMEVYTHEGQFAEIARRSVRPYDGEIVNLEARYSQGFPLKLTPDHPVFVVTVCAPFKKWKPEITSKPFWLPAKDIDRERHWLVVPRPKKTLDLHVDPEFARLCGYYLAEGYGRKKRQYHYPNNHAYHVCFAFHAKETEYMEDVRTLMQQFFGTTRGWISKTGNGVTLGFYSRDGYFTLTGLFGQGTRNKAIPSHWINGVSDDAAKQLILGAYRGDGCKSDSDFRYDYGTASLSLAVSMRLLLLRLGIMTELTFEKPRESNIAGRVIVGHGLFHVRAAGENSLKLASITENTVKPVQRTFWYGRMDDDFAYIPIKRIGTEWYSGLVYNMDVKDDHSYAHPTCIVHNCARGFVVKALREQGLQACGIDISQWAIDNCDPDVKAHVIQASLMPPVDWILAKDVLEHVTDLVGVLYNMKAAARAGIFVVVPLSPRDGDPYIVPEYEKDVTHIHRLTLPTWAALFMQPGWSVEASYRVPGVKDNYARAEMGNGFITCRRLKP